MPWIPDSLLVELGFRILIVSGIADSLSCIPDFKAQDSGFQSTNFLDSAFHKQKFYGLRYPDSLTWGKIEDALELCNRNPARMILKHPSKSQSGGWYPSFVPWDLNKKWIL